MRKNVFNSLMLAGLMLAPMAMTSCLNNDEETIVLEEFLSGIPSDSQATPNPSVPSPNANIPNIQTTLESTGGEAIIRIDMTGISDSDFNWLRLYGTGHAEQNVWVEVDGIAKGILVINNEDDQSSSVKVDLVFTIDNSGSMSEEADAVARDIKSWAQQLSNSGIDIRFGVVGYGGYVDGAIDLTTVDNMSAYLDEATGVRRTQHFGGANASLLQTYANSFPHASSSVSTNECGAMGIEFADKYFSFRSGANRIYVNFTDEPNQPNNNTNYSVEFFKSQSNWAAAQGTVHTVFSGSKFTYNRIGDEEQPWLISEYTGGTTLYTNSSFSGITLSSLPVTGAMQHSYIIRFANIRDKLDGRPHLIHVTVVSKDGKVRADKTFTAVLGSI